MQNCLADFIQKPASLGTKPAGVAHFFKNRKTLVTGGQGFVGRALATKLRDLGANVLIVDAKEPPPSAAVGEAFGGGVIEFCQADCSDLLVLKKLVADCAVVFSLAGRCGHAESMCDPLGDLFANSVGPLAVLEACRRWNPNAHVIFAGTRQVYGCPRYLPVDEAHPLAPVDANGIHKMAADLHHLLYYHNHGLRTSILRLTNTYGPGMNVGKVGQSFLGAWLDRLVGGKDLLVFGDGCQMRDIAFIDDVVDAFLSVASEPAVSGGEVFNVGGKEACSLNEIAGVLLELWPARAAMQHSPFPEGQDLIEIGDYQADLQKMATHFGWRPHVGLREGLSRTVAWMQRVGLVRAGKGACES